MEENYPIPVLINIYPGKVRRQDTQEGLAFVKETMRRWLEDDLRATLRMGNVLTGGLYVDLQHVKNAESTELRTVNGYDVIPTVSNEFTQITQKADAILDKINDLPLEGMVHDVRTALLDMKEAAASVEATSDDFDALVTSIDAEAINDNLNNVLVSMEALLKNYSEGGLSQSEIKETVDTMQETLRNIQPLLLQLNKSPNSLIFSDSQGDDIQPKAARNQD